jgi:branched-chain amino acid transport system substrate-binding protein
MKLDRRQFLTTAAAGGATLAAGNLGFLREAVAQGSGPIKIGTLSPLTGAGSVYGTILANTYKIVAEDINKQGGIGGRPIQLVVEDGQTNPDAAVRAAKKLIEVDRVNILLGTWSSAVTLAVAPLTAAAKVPHFNVSSSSAVTSFKDDDFLYRTYTSQVLVSGIYTTAAQKLGFKSAALVLLNNPYGVTLGDTFAERFQKAGGKITGRVVYNPNQASYRSEVQEALSGKPDVIVFGGYTADGILVFKEWFQLGLGGTWMGPGFAFNQQFIQGIGQQAAEGIIVVEAIPALGSPALAHLTKLYQASYKTDPEFFAAMGYDHMHVVSLAALAAKSSDGTAIRDNIRKVSNPPGKAVGTWAEAAPLVRKGEEIDYQGASGSCDFDAAGDVYTDFGIHRIKAGKWVLEQTIKAAEIKAA